MRYSTRFINYKDRKEFCNDMKAIYATPNEKARLAALNRFEEMWSGKYSYTIKRWSANWQSLSTFFNYPPEIRRLIYTTNPIENLNRRIRKVTKTKSSFPTDESLFKILYLIVVDITDKWTLPFRDSGDIIMNQLRVYFVDRVDVYL